MTDVRQINVHRWRDLVAKDRTIPAGCYRLAYLLASFVNAEKGYAWPSIKRLARELGVDEKTVRRHVRGLERAGYLDVSRSHRNETTNEYRLRFPAESAPVKEDRIVHSGGQSRPERGDKTVRQHPLKNTFRNSFSRTGPAKQRDRGKLEVAIANRLGTEGMAVLWALPDDQVQQLCDLQRLGRLSDTRLFEAKQAGLAALALANSRAGTTTAVAPDVDAMQARDGVVNTGDESQVPATDRLQEVPL